MLEGLLYVLAVGIIFFLFGVARGKERLCLKAGEEVFYLIVGGWGCVERILVNDKFVVCHQFA